MGKKRHADVFEGCTLPRIKPYQRMSPYAYYGGYVIRRLCSFAPFLGLVPKADRLHRKPGISALARIRNEPWIEPSLHSLKGFADEIIIVDSSIDDTPARTKKTIREHNLNAKYLYRKCDLLEASEIALRKSTCQWLLKWDGDFVGYTSRLRDLRKRIMTLPAAKYCIVEFPLICVDVDLLHVRKDISPYHIEGWIYKYSPVLRYTVHPKFRYEKMYFPKYYEKIYIDQVLVMHLRSVKPPDRLLRRQYQSAWIGEENKARYSYSFEKYLQFCVERDYGVSDPSQIMNAIAGRLKDSVEPYSKAKYGDYPRILKDYAREELGIEL